MATPRNLPLLRQCEKCGDDYISRTNLQRFCSLTCQADARNERRNARLSAERAAIVNPPRRGRPPKNLPKVGKNITFLLDEQGVEDLKTLQDYLQASLSTSVRTSLGWAAKRIKARTEKT